MDLLEKLSQDLPGGFNLNQPYAMPGRVRRQVGAPAPKQRGLPGQTTGTVRGSQLGTVSGMKRNLGTAMKAAANMLKGSPVQKRLFGGGLSVKPRMRIGQKPRIGMIRYGSHPTLEQAEQAADPRGYVARRLLTKEGQHARLVQTMKALSVLENTDDDNVKVAALLHLAELNKEARFGALLRAGLGAARHGAGTLARSKLFWGTAGLAGAGYGISRLVGGAERKTQEIQKKRLKGAPKDIRGIFERAR